MTILARACFGLLLVGAPAVARAELAVGAAAPTFTAQAAQGGSDLTFSLSEALGKGPVVVYFYPKSFTRVCTEEAHLFAEAVPEFAALGASVIGISTDTIDIQREFSRLECRDRFPVAADPDGTVARSYDALLVRPDSSSVMARRTSYVITPDGKIASVLTASDAASHIETAVASVKAWKAGRDR
jgi:peroxiredoxin